MIIRHDKNDIWPLITCSSLGESVVDLQQNNVQNDGVFYHGCSFNKSKYNHEYKSIKIHLPRRHKGAKFHKGRGIFEYRILNCLAANFLQRRSNSDPMINILRILN